MTRGHPPYVAIGEAGRKAKARGWLVLVLEPAGELPFHFVTCDRGRVSLVRVRRLKYPGYGTAEIEHSCKNDIAALRSVTVTAAIFRELWVRGPDRHWYRFLVLPDSLVVMGDDDLPDDHETEDIEPGSKKPDTRLPDETRPDPKGPETFQSVEKEPGVRQPEEMRPDPKEPDAHLTVEIERYTQQSDGVGLPDGRPVQLPDNTQQQDTWDHRILVPTNR